MTDLTHRALLRRMANLQRDINQFADVLEERASAHRTMAQDTCNVADMITEMGVDNATVNDCYALSEAAARVGDAATGFIQSCRDIPSLADAVAQNARTADDGIQEQADLHGPEIYSLDREFLRVD